MPRISLPLLATLAVLPILGGCGGRSAGGHGHDHEHDGTTVTVWTDSTELFVEYPTLVAGQQSEPWGVHVTRLRDFSPVPHGSLRLRFERREGGAYVTEVEAPARPGIFTPAPMIPEPGIYRLVVELAGSYLRDRMVVGAVQVFESEAHAPHPPDPPHGQITFLKEQQWPIDFMVARADVREVEQSIEARGEVVPAAGAEVVVTAPVDGVIQASRPPGEGQAVRAGQTLAAVRLPGAGGGGATAADLVAVRARIERLEREVARAERLYAVEAIPETRLAEARHDLEVARAELAALRGGGSPGDAVRIAAPISGIVAERMLSPGARVVAGQPLFRIVDPGALQLRLEIPARYATEALRAESAVFTVEGGGQAYRASGRVGASPAIDPTTRTLPVHLAVQSNDGTLRAGMRADALVFLGGREQGTTIPVTAVQEEDGQPVAYIQTGGESFERRPLRLGPSDGEFVIVHAGVEVGEMVVTSGAYAVHLASLNTSEIGHGHTH
jgi:membrane fusion protein, heavy metal efflux system